MQLNQKSINDRRNFIEKTSLGLFGICSFEKMAGIIPDKNNENNQTLNKRYPAIDEELAYHTVNLAHFELEKVKA